MTVSKSLLAGSLIAVIGAGALPAVGQAETTTTTTVKKTYNISVNPDQLAAPTTSARRSRCATRRAASPTGTAVRP